MTVVSFRRAAPLVSLDLIRTIDSATELFVSGSIPRLSVGAPNPVSGDGDGTLSPDGLQIGVNYRIRRQRDPDTRARQWPYVGLFIGGFERSGSSPISLPASVSAGSNTAPRSVALRFPGGWGIGVHGGYRYRFNEQFTLDVNVKWQHLGMVLGENASLAWNPILITGGVVVRLF